MTTPDYRALCEELLNELSAYKMANPMHDWYLLNRARVALAEPEPPAYREVAGLVAWLHGQDGGIDRRATYSRIADLLSRLALQPVPKGPSDQELADVFAEGCIHAGKSGEPPFLGGARAVLARWGRP